MRDAKKRLRRTMMFLNAQKPGLIKDPFMHFARLIIMERNGLYVSMAWTHLSGRKISVAQ